MSLSLVFYSEGIAAAKNHLYLADGGLSSYKLPEKWYSIGLIQNFRIELDAVDFLPKLSFGFLGVNLRDSEPPELQDGGFIMCMEHFFSTDDEKDAKGVRAIPTSTDCLLGFTRKEPKDTAEHPIYHWLSNRADVLGGVRNCVIGGNIEDGITIELTAPDYDADFLKWTKNVPPWIKLQLTDVETGDIIREVGTDGNIDQV